MKNPQNIGFVEMLRRRWPVIVGAWAIGIALLVVVAKHAPPNQKATAKLLLVSQAFKDTTEINPDLPTIVTSTEVLNRVIKDLNLNTNTTYLAQTIKTKSPTKASSIELTYQDANGATAAAVANAVADESAHYFHEVATHGYAESIRTLNERLAECKSKIAATDRLLQSKRAYASSDKALDDLTSQIDELRGQQRQLASSLEADRVTEDALNRETHDIDPIVRGEILSKDVVYQQTELALAKDVADLNSERASFRDNFPGLAALRSRVERERRELKSLEALSVRNGAGMSSSSTQSLFDRERAAATVAADAVRLASTNEQLGNEEKRLEDVANANAAISTLRAERSADLEQYLSLTQRLGTAQGDAAQAASLGTLVVVSRAVPVPSESRKELLAIGAILMLALAIGIGHLVDGFDRRLWDVREIEHVYGRPVLIEVGAKR